MDRETSAKISPFCIVCDKFATSWLHAEIQGVEQTTFSVCDEHADLTADDLADAIPEWVEAHRDWVTCDSCECRFYYDVTGMTYDEDGNENEMRFCEWSGKDVCQWCLESDYEHGSTIIRFAPDGKDVVKFGEYDAFDAETGEIPSWFDDLSVKRGWVKTDAWRGYSTFDTTKGYVKLTDGWITDFPDSSVSHKFDVFAFADWIQNQETTPPAPIYVLIGTTSNIFSQTIEVICHEDDRKVITDWLAENGFGVERLERAFA